MKKDGYKKDGRCYVLCEDHYVEVNEEVFYAFMRPIWREEKRKQREYRCRNGKGVRCDGNCEMCEQYRFKDGPTGSPLSLEQLFEDDGFEAKGSEGHADAAILAVTLKALIEEMQDLVPDPERYVNMLKYGELEKDVAAELGIPKTTLNYRMKKVKDFLRDRLKEFR